MSALGQKQTFRGQCPLCAISGHSENVFWLSLKKFNRLSLQHQQVGGVKEPLMFDDFAIFDPPADRQVYLERDGFGTFALGVVAKANVEKAPNHIASSHHFL